MNKGLIAIIAGSIAAIAAVPGIIAIAGEVKEHIVCKNISGQTGIPYAEVKTRYENFVKAQRAMKKGGASKDQVAELEHVFYYSIEKLAAEK